MLLRAQIDLQPNFPREDVSEDNAGFLEVMVANPTFTGTVHEAVHFAQWPFYVGHSATIIATGRTFELDGARVEAIECGIRVLEAMTVVLGGVVDTSGLEVTVSAASFTSGDVSDAQQSKFFAAVDEFHDQMPVSSEIIRAASSRMVGESLINYALLGAAIERQIALGEGMR